MRLSFCPDDHRTRKLKQPAMYLKNLGQENQKRAELWVSKASLRVITVKTWLTTARTAWGNCRLVNTMSLNQKASFHSLHRYRPQKVGQIRDCSDMRMTLCSRKRRMIWSIISGMSEDPPRLTHLWSARLGRLSLASKTSKYRSQKLRQRHKPLACLELSSQTLWAIKKQITTLH